jgi:predicted GNAT superfamily acetyltransferase
VSGFIAPPFESRLFATLLALNNAHAEELSYQTPEAFRDLLSRASHVRAEPRGLALLVAFNERCSYDNPNFNWLRARFPQFNYIDRVVVHESARGLGHARTLYAGLEKHTLAERRQRLVCEINLIPPNPNSDAFHLALGFIPAGEQVLAGKSKTVRYWVKEIG